MPGGDGFGHRAGRVSGEYVVDYSPKRRFIGHLAGGGQSPLHQLSDTVAGHPPHAVGVERRAPSRR
jgi:hypothetical protein